MSQPIEQEHVEDSPNYALGTSREYPENEDAPLQEELLFHEKGTPYGRVLNCFEFRIDGEPVVVRPGLISKGGSSELEVVGMTGTIYNKEGMFAQCGWFGNHDLDWFWVSIKGITEITTKRDLRFRRGQVIQLTKPHHPWEWCIWLHTHLGQYALLLPRGSYREMWEETAAGLGPTGLPALFRQWPASGPRPGWWDERWKGHWPFESEAGSKRRASDELEQYEANTREDRKLPGKWVLLGSRGEKANQGEMRTNLHQRGQWDLSPHGMMPTRSKVLMDVGGQGDKPKVQAASRSSRRRKASKVK